MNADWIIATFIDIDTVLKRLKHDRHALAQVPVAPHQRAPTADLPHCSLVRDVRPLGARSQGRHKGVCFSYTHSP